MDSQISLYLPDKNTLDHIV